MIRKAANSRKALAIAIAGPCTLAAAAFAIGPGAAISVAVPTIFAPGIVSSPAADAAITFTADGREAYFERGNGNTLFILATRNSRHGWSTPTIAPFSGRWMDFEPAVSPDGKALIFVSNRPVRGTTPIDGFYYGKPHVGRGGNLWRVDRVGDGWSAPRRLSDAINSNTSLYEPSIGSNGDLFYQQAVGDRSRFRIFVAHASSGSYGQPHMLELQAPSDASDMDPAIARDGSYLIFASDRSGGANRLFITFRSGNGWTAPRALDAINATGPVGDPRIGPEPDRLYFTSKRLSAPTGNPNADLRNVEGWNNGLTNIWWITFSADAWRQ